MSKLGDRETLDQAVSRIAHGNFDTVSDAIRQGIAWAYRDAKRIAESGNGYFDTIEELERKAKEVTRG